MPARKTLLVVDNLCVEASRRSVYRLMAEQREFKVHLLVPRLWKETTGEVGCENESSARLHIHTTGIFFGFRHHRVLYADLFHTVRNIRPDFLLAVHAPENYATAQLLLARKYLLPTMKVGLFASRNIDLPVQGFPFKFAFLSSACDWMTSRAKVDVIYHRPRSCGHLYEKYSRNALYVPHSVDCLVFKPNPSSKHRNSELLTIGFVGRLTEEKGVHILLRAFVNLPQYARLVIVGEGPQQNYLQMMARSLGIADRVIFEPPVPYVSMAGLLCGFDVLALPSIETPQWQELFGRVLIEAMACEVPVIASHSGGIPEVVGDAGILFRSGNADDLTVKLSRLLEDPIERAELGRRGRERTKSLFDTRVVAGILTQDINARLGH